MEKLKVAYSEKYIDRVVGKGLQQGKFLHLFYLGSFFKRKFSSSVFGILHMYIYATNGDDFVVNCDTII